MNVDVYSIVKEALEQNDLYMIGCAQHAKSVSEYITKILVDKNVDLLNPSAEDAKVMSVMLSALLTEGINSHNAIEQHLAIKH